MKWAPVLGPRFAVSIDNDSGEDNALKNPGRRGTTVNNPFPGLQMRSGEARPALSGCHCSMTRCITFAELQHTGKLL